MIVRVEVHETRSDYVTRVDQPLWLNEPACVACGRPRSMCPTDCPARLEGLWER